MEVEFDRSKMTEAVRKANLSVVEGEQMSQAQIEEISKNVEIICAGMNRALNVEEIQDLVENQIMNQKAFRVASNYITYRYKRALVRKSNSTDQQILSLLECNNEEVIQELLNLAKQIQAAQGQGGSLGLSDEELAFYDAITKPENIKDFYENETLVALTKELTETLRRNKTIDWEKKESARAKMRITVKRLLKRYDYPPEGMETALQTVIAQCELWTDSVA